METHTKTTAKDFFINLGAIVALYTSIVSLGNLLFTVINSAYPQIADGYNYFGSSSISWPVATLIIFFPIFIFLMWLLEKDYKVHPEKQSSGIHRWLTYITLFIAGLTIAIDLITVLYYFLDGKELTTAFILKVLVLLVIASGVFSYYLADVLGKLTTQKRNIYRVVSVLIIIASIVWGFTVLGSPSTQRMIKHDEQRVMDLQNINSLILNYYELQRILPESVTQATTALNTYYVPVAVDPETKKEYIYEKTGKTTYNLCAEFNKVNSNPDMFATSIDYQSWSHPEGYHCFNRTINPANYPKVEPEFKPRMIR